MSLNRIYHPYWKWEDFLSGMWRKVDRTAESKMLKEAICFTGDHMKYGIAMQKVVFAWPVTMEHNLTNSSLNRKAFVGHCAVQYELKIPEYIVRSAWKQLTDRQRYLANCQAELAIKKWEEWYVSKNRSIHKNLGKQMLLQWPT